MGRRNFSLLRFVSFRSCIDLNLLLVESVIGEYPSEKCDHISMVSNLITHDHHVTILPLIRTKTGVPHSRVKVDTDFGLIST